MPEKTIKLNSNEEAIAIYGTLDENLRYAEKQYHVKIAARNYKLRISGKKTDVDAAFQFFTMQLAEIRQNMRKPASRKSARVQAAPAGDESGEGEVNGNGNRSHFYHKGRIVRAKSPNQQTYLDAIDQKDIVACIGPAGTGKTYLAMAAAIEHLKNKQVGRIVMTRPAVEAGENLGFLPGDLYAKVNPYLRPLYDALHDMMDYEEVARYIDRGIIEVAPLAFMRGRTLNDSFVILDEAQNCTAMQIKMFLTRLGQSSKAVLTGDVTQIDLPSGKECGLTAAQKILGHIKGIQFCYLKETDVVRHHLIQEIIAAYEVYETKHKKH